MSSHLSSEQFNDTLHGLPSAEVSRHLDRCGVCAQELASLGGALIDLRSSAAAFAEQQRQRSVAAPAMKHGLPGFVWALGAAALAVSFAAPLALTHRNAVRGTVHSQGASVSVAISDEALLDSVQKDLSSGVPAPMLALAGTSTSTSTSPDSNTDQRKYE